MKRTVIFLMLLAALACTVDDDPQPAPKKADIAGKWYYVAKTTNADHVELYVNDCETQPDYLVFEDDGSLTLVESNQDCVSNTDQSGTWSLQDFSLTVTDYDPAAYFEGFMTITYYGKATLIVQQQVEPLNGDPYYVNYEFSRGE